MRIHANSSPCFIVARLSGAGVALLAGLAGCAPQPQLSVPRPEVREQLHDLSDARTRIVWLQDVENEGDVFGRRARMALIGLDSSDPRGERVLVEQTGYYAKPLLTPNGERVVFSDYSSEEVFVVNWDGSGLRKLADGKAVAVWRDAATEREWVFIQRGPQGGDAFKENPIFKHLIDDPGSGELVWDRTAISAFDAGNFQLSADGKRAAGLFPWPDAGVADLQADEWERVASGCWTGMAPDNSYRMWVFDGAHRNLFMTAPDGTTTAKIHLAKVAADGRGETYHPRWSNHPRFLVFTSPYILKEGSRFSGGRQVEVVVGRFNAALTDIEAWVTVSRNNRGDYFPDLWVDRDPMDGGSGAVEAVAAQGASTKGHGWPGDVGGLVLKWENASKKNAVVDPASGREFVARMLARGYGRYGRYHVMDMAGGRASFELEKVDTEWLDTLKGGYGISVEATIQALTTPETAMPVITLGSSVEDADFSVVQKGNELLVVIRVTEQGRDRHARLELGPLPIDEPVHVAFTYRPYGEFRGYINGEQVARTDKISGRFTSWSARRLAFGGSNGDESWSGRIDGVAIYDTGLDYQALQRHADWNAERLAGRTDAERLVLIARAEEVTAPPSPDAIAPYRRCLVVNRYTVEDVISGELEDRDILVAHWGILDGKVVKEGSVQVGRRYRLQIEKYDDHPQLVSERMDMDTLAFELPLFHDPVPGGAGARAVDRVGRVIAGAAGRAVP